MTEQEDPPAPTGRLTMKELEAALALVNAVKAGWIRNEAAGRWERDAGFLLLAHPGGEWQVTCRITGRKIFGGYAPEEITAMRTADEAFESAMQAADEASGAA